MNLKKCKKCKTKVSESSLQLFNGYKVCSYCSTELSKTDSKSENKNKSSEKKSKFKLSRMFSLKPTKSKINTKELSLPNSKEHNIKSTFRLKSNSLNSDNHKKKYIRLFTKKSIEGNDEGYLKRKKSGKSNELKDIISLKNQEIINLKNEIFKLKNLIINDNNYKCPMSNENGECIHNELLKKERQDFERKFIELKVKNVNYMDKLLNMEFEIIKMGKKF